MDIVVLSILSTLTSDTLVIQREVKILRHLDPSNLLPISAVESHLSIIILMVLSTILGFFLYGTSYPRVFRPDLVDILLFTILCPFLMLDTVLFLMSLIWSCLLFHYFASLWFSNSVMALGATGEGQLDSRVVGLTEDVNNVNFALPDPKPLKPLPLLHEELAMALGASGQGQLGSGTIVFTDDVNNVNFALPKRKQRKPLKPLPTIHEENIDFAMALGEVAKDSSVPEPWCPPTMLITSISPCLTRNRWRLLHPSIKKTLIFRWPWVQVAKDSSVPKLLGSPTSGSKT